MTNKEQLIAMIKTGKSESEIIKAFKKNDENGWLSVADEYEEDFTHWAKCALMHTEYKNMFNR